MPHCKGKITHTTVELAAAARQSLIDDGGDAETLEVYQCFACQGFHVGHKRKAKQQAAAPTHKVKGPTPGQQRRAAARAAEKAERQKFFQDYHDTLVYCNHLRDNEIARMIALGAKPRTVQQQET